jgi:hypothetical protein
LGFVSLAILAACSGADEPIVPEDGGSGADAAADAVPDAVTSNDAAEGGLTGPALVDAITKLASSSSCAAYSWKNRGKAPPGYTKGVALVFARAVCNPTRSDVTVVAKAKTADTQKDALAWYDAIFTGLGMSNEVAGLDTLRHTYVLLLGLGMRESSGEHCTGRDMSATNTTSDSAEAGAWQTSWDSRTSSPELPKLFAQYKSSANGCLLSTFAEGVTCSAANWQNWGTGADGLEFQKLSKECPGFAAEYAAVMIRVNGGSVGHYGPLRTKAAEVRPECDDLFAKVQGLVQANPGACGAL